MPMITPQSTIFFLCDLQSVFRKTIAEFDHLVFSANKLITLAKALNCDVVSCTQASKALGPLDPALNLASLGPLHLGTFDKSSFSMLTPEIENILKARPGINNVVLFGIESHICVLHTALGLLFPTIRTDRYTPYIIADCLASHNRWETPIAIERMRQEGAIITTSESVAFELLGTARHPQFKAFSRFIKESMEATERAGKAIILGEETSLVNNFKNASL